MKTGFLISKVFKKSLNFISRRFTQIEPPIHADIINYKKAFCENLRLNLRISAL